MKLLAVAFCGVLVSTSAFAQSGSGGMTGSGADLSSSRDTQEQADESARGNDGERRICRRVEVSSSSRMSTRRVCRTAQEWREAQRGN